MEACEPTSPAREPSACAATPGDPTQGAEGVSASASWQTRLGPGKELTATDSTIAAGAHGQKLIVAGRVLDTRCRALAGAAVDAWQVTADGVYGPADEGGGARCCYLTGGMRTDEKGRYEVTTVMPGHYSGQPAHIHFGISALSGQHLLTEIHLANDPLLQGRNEINIAAVSNGDAAGALRAAFDFVLPTGG
jgi:protocatechuate 3,4-dioxygenase beta subunit